MSAYCRHSRSFPQLHRPWNLSHPSHQGTWPRFPSRRFRRPDHRDGIDKVNERCLMRWKEMMSADCRHSRSFPWHHRPWNVSHPSHQGTRGVGHDEPMPWHDERRASWENYELWRLTLKPKKEQTLCQQGLHWEKLYLKLNLNDEFMKTSWTKDKIYWTLMMN
jgi:hypothetical protein